MKKLGLTLLCWGLLLAPMACNDVACFHSCCGVVAISLVDIEGVQPYLMELRTEPTEPRHVRDGYSTLEGSASAQEFIIGVEGEWKVLEERDLSQLYPSPYGLYACSVAPPKVARALERVTVVASAPLVTEQRTWAAGESLADFLQYSNGYGWAQSFSEIADQFDEDEGYYTLYLQPTLALSEPFEGTFTITWTLSDGDTLTTTTDGVSLIQ